MEQSGIPNVLLTCGGFRGGEPALPPSPFGQWTDAVTHGTPDMWHRYMYNGDMVLRIFKMIATSGLLTAWECIKSFSTGDLPRTLLGDLTVALSHPLDGLRGPTSKGSGGKAERGGGRQGEGPALMQIPTLLTHSL